MFQKMFLHNINQVIHSLNAGLKSLMTSARRSRNNWKVNSEKSGKNYQKTRPVFEISLLITLVPSENLLWPWKNFKFW